MNPGHAEKGQQSCNYNTLSLQICRTRIFIISPVNKLERILESPSLSVRTNYLPFQCSSNIFLWKVSLDFHTCQVGEEEGRPISFLLDSSSSSNLRTLHAYIMKCRN